MRSCLAILLCILLPFERAHAWSEGGHHLIALMAFNQLPKPRQAELIRILKNHPRFQQDFKLPAAVRNEEKWLIGRAGYWPDMVRSQPLYDRPNWHYEQGPIDTVGKVDGVPSFPGDELLDGANLDSQELHLRQALRLCYKIFRSPDEADSRKAIAICWIANLVADAHQPCHAGSMYVENVFPTGDRSASLIPTNQGRNLHAVWDGLLGQSYNERELVRHISTIDALGQLHSTVGIGSTSSHPNRIDTWLAESRETAQVFVYAVDVSTSIGVALRDKTTHLPTAKLSEGYLKNAERAAQLRAMQASTRLAMMLRE